MTQTRVAGRNERTQGPSRRTRSGSITLTGRGAAVALFAACFLGLLIAAWTGWDLLADLRRAVRDIRPRGHRWVERR